MATFCYSDCPLADRFFSASPEEQVEIVRAANALERLTLLECVTGYGSHLQQYLRAREGVYAVLEKA